MKADSLVLTGILHNLTGQKSVQRAGDHTQMDYHRGTDTAVPEGQRSGVQFLQRRFHLFLVKPALLRQTDISAHFLKQLHTTQIVFQVMDGTAQGRLRNTQSGSCQRIMLRLCQHGKITKVIVIHNASSDL